MKFFKVMQWPLWVRRVFVATIVISPILALLLNNFQQTKTIASVFMIGFYIVSFIILVLGDANISYVTVVSKLDEWQLHYRNEILSKSFSLTYMFLIILSLLYFFLPEGTMWTGNDQKDMGILCVFLFQFMLLVPKYVDLWMRPEDEKEELK